MSALAEALVAAQRRALSAMEKQYAAGKMSAEAAHTIMDSFGCTDGVDQDRLIAVLEVIRVYGAQLPAEPPGDSERPAEKATPAQLARIRKDLTAANLPILAEQDAASLTKAQASEIIDSLAKGTYDPTKYDVPF